MKNRACTEQRLIDAVKCIVRKEGFNGLGVNKVAREAGVSKCLIYRYFGSFEHLLSSSTVEKGNGSMLMSVLL
jgi:AcrR family transcriptional regulator